MKTYRIILIALISFFCAGLNAQVFVGGNFNINISGGNTDNGNITTDNPTYFGLTLSPLAGKFLSEKVAVGIGLNISYNRANTPGTPDIVSHTSTVGFNPFLRYYAVKWNKFSVFGQGNINLSFSGSETHTGDTSTDGPKNTSIGINVLPGLAFDVSEKLSLETSINILRFGYSYDINKSGNNTDRNSSFNFGAGLSNIASLGNISIGAIFKF